MKNNKIILVNISLIAIFVINYSLIGFKAAGVIKNITKIKTEKTIAAVNLKDERDNELFKSNEDLLNADYKAFYDDLKPYGTWVEVNLNNKKSDTRTKAGQTGLSDALRNILGIKDAKADVDFGWSIFYVWRPSPSLAIGISAGEPSPMYIPYTNGRWIYSDYGWYFRAATPYEEITHHYGRWIFVVSEGWIWVPGNVWAPAWVSWDDDDDYVMWTPGTPGIYFAADYYGLPYHFEPNYIVCERRYFLEPDVYRFSSTYRDHEFRERFHDMRRNEGLTYAGNNNFYRGPDTRKLERDLGRRINPVNINMVSNKEQVSYNKKQYNVYTPVSKVKNNGKFDAVRRNGQTITRDNEKSGQNFRNNNNFFKSDNRKAPNEVRYRSDFGNKKSGNNISPGNRSGDDKTKFSRNYDNSRSKNNFGNQNRDRNNYQRQNRDNYNYQKQSRDNYNYQKQNRDYNNYQRQNRDNGNNKSPKNRSNGLIGLENKQIDKNKQIKGINRKYADDSKMHPGNEIKNYTGNKNDAGMHGGNKKH